MPSAGDSGQAASPQTAATGTIKYESPSFGAALKESLFGDPYKPVDTSVPIAKEGQKIETVCKNAEIKYQERVELDVTAHAGVWGKRNMSAPDYYESCIRENKMIQGLPPAARKQMIEAGNLQPLPGAP